MRPIRPVALKYKSLDPTGQRYPISFGNPITQHLRESVSGVKFDIIQHVMDEITRETT